MPKPIDARSLENDQRIDTDICIVGAGAAGITMALELARRHIDTCLLESGGLQSDAETQALYEGVNAGRSYFDLASSRLRFFGGTTNHWAGVCAPLDPIDLEKRDWVPHSGWPIAYEELAAYYERARRYCELDTGSEKGSFNLEPEDDRAIPFDRDRIRTCTLSFSPPTRFGDAYREELEGLEALRVYLHANALEIEPEREGRRVRRIRFATLEGSHFFVHARQFVLATGGIENPRLLLASRSIRPQGLGNEHDLVGRYFMEHPHMDDAGEWVLSDPSLHRSFYEWPDPADGYRGASMGILAIAAPLLRREKLLGFSAELRITSPNQESAAFRSFRTLVQSLRRGEVPSDPGKHVRRVLGDLDAAFWGAYERAWGGPSAGAEYQVIVRSEQAPNPESRLTLDEKHRDALGMPRPRLAWRLSSLDRDSLLRGLGWLAREVGREGWGRVRVVDPQSDPDWTKSIHGGWHHMGTTRMASDPSKGVVDGHGRLHSLPNLLVAGSSVFPTAGWANPTLTLVALTIRMSDLLARERGRS